MLKTAAPDRIAFQHETELRAMWQSRILKATEHRMHAVVLSMLSHSYRDAMSVLLKVTYPGIAALTLPMLCSCGKVQKNGVVTADVRTKANELERNVVFFQSVDDLQARFRLLADRLKLSDADRVELFGMVQRWIVCDFRKGPNGEDLSE